MLVHLLHAYLHSESPTNRMVLYAFGGRRVETFMLAAQSRTMVENTKAGIQQKTSRAREKVSYSSWVEHMIVCLDSLLLVMSQILRTASSPQLTKQGVQQCWVCSHKHHHHCHLLYPSITATCSPTSHQDSSKKLFVAAGGSAHRGNSELIIRIGAISKKNHIQARKRNNQ